MKTTTVFLLSRNNSNSLPETGRAGETLHISQPDSASYYTAQAKSCEDILSLARSSEPTERLLLTGSESGGETGHESLAILFSTALKAFPDARVRPSIIVQGGIATPEIAAAYLCSGAHAVVLESVHWLTADVPLDDVSKSKIRSLRPDHTRVVGTRIGAPHRFFDKGNSRAVKELEQLANSLCGESSPEQAQKVFREAVEKRVISPMQATFSADELIPLGAEAAFAAQFAEEFGTSTQVAVQRFAHRVMELCNEAPGIVAAFGTTARQKGLETTHPFIQGGMTWISDSPEFALEVARAGALPTLAAGGRDKAMLQRDFGALPEVMGDFPYAINILVLDENPRRDEQVEWIEEHRPPYAVIAAGNPAFARRLKDKGIRTIYLCPDEGLLRLALEAGVDVVVLEGNEAGGHVGSHTTQMLAQSALYMRRNEPELFRSSIVALAGGIHDRQSILRAAIMGADAVQMGTVYLTTREIVTSGALPELYQKMVLQARPGATAISGETVGLRVRSLKTPRMEHILELERSFASGREEETTFRQKLERLSVGTLLVATRQTRTPDGAPLPEEVCLQEGQYMCGAVGGCLDNTVDLKTLHSELASGEIHTPSFTTRKQQESSVKRPSSSRPSPTPAGERIAITGMSLVNALGNDVESFWQNCLAMKSGIVEVPATRWDHSQFFSADPRERNRTYSPVGAFMDLELARKDLWVSPQDFRTMSESTKLTLYLGRKAIESSGLHEAGYDPARVSIIVSQNSGEAASTLKDQIIHMAADELAQQAAQALGLGPEEAARIALKYREGKLGVDDTTLIGRLNCTAGGHLSNRYGFMGPSHSVGAACATSLVALHCAVMLLRQGIIDAAVVGGGEDRLSIAHYLEFSALGALAGVKGQRPFPQQYSCPFSKDRDGFVMGEGGAVIILERESTARARGAQPLGYITGVGAANNDKGIVESVAESQIVALEQSFADAGYGPEDVDLVECHATSTIQGDHEEVAALKSIYPKQSGAVLAALKSQVGHTLGASGATALAHALLAMRDGVFPPTLNQSAPDPEIALEDHGFSVCDTPTPWTGDKGRPRRAQVNAFGFGGASYVIHLEGCEQHRHTVYSGTPQAMAQPAPEQSGDIRAFRIETGQGQLRAAVSAYTSVEGKSAVLSVLPEQDFLAPANLARMARKGVYLAPEESSPAPLAMIFSGQGGFYPGMGKDLYESVPEIRKVLDSLNELADYDLLDVLFSADERTLRNTRWQQPALFALEYAIARYLLDRGLTPTALAGHSLGELTALTVAGAMSLETGFEVVNRRGMYMDMAAGLSSDPGTMIATNAPIELVEQELDKVSMSVVTNYNSPNQTVFGGHSGETLHVGDALEKLGFRCHPLPVHMAFHSPIMRKIKDRFATFLAGADIKAPSIPVVSNVTGKDFPDDPQLIRELLAEHVERAVKWKDDVRTLWEEHGVRQFLEVGPGNVLCTFVSDTCEQARCVSTCAKGNEQETLLRARAALCAWGHAAPDFPVEPLHRSPVSAASYAPATRPGSAPGPGSTPKSGSTQKSGGVVEDVIGIIMEATGYERDEIEPEMDIRQDLAIRSSRLPVIMDQAEKLFDIEIKIEDFIGVNTIEEMAERIAELSGRPLYDAAPANSVVEDVIGIIMEATGYERDEIEPEMDIRQDLAIRSSRLPVIMDQAEKLFDIEIRIEDFIGVNTIQEMADRIAEIRGDAGQTATTGKSTASPAERATAARTTAPVAAQTGQEAAQTGQEVARHGQQQDVAEGTVPATRLGFRSEALPDTSEGTLSLSGDSCLAVVALAGAGELATSAAEEMAEMTSARVVPLELDVDTPEDCLKELREIPELSGLLFVVGAPGGPDTALAAIKATFPLIRELLSRKTRRLCMLLYRRDEEETGLSILTEGMVGMLLAAALEYDSVLFRAMGLDSGTNLKKALRRGLCPGGPVQMLFRDGLANAIRAVNEPVGKSDQPEISVAQGDVIVLSGGAAGVTLQLAHALGRLGARLILLGRRPESDDRVRSALEEMSRAQIAAEYHSVDVSDSRAVSEVCERVFAEHGRIDGVVHGAGVLRDALLVNSTDSDFSLVTDTKVLGCANLYAATRDRGLRFFIGLSSVAAWQGNVGQANYCAANRAMAAMLRGLHRQGCGCKTIWLPPIAGTGMADSAETRELMRLKGLDKAYVHVSELAELFLRELYCGPAEEPWVMFSRPMPTTRTTLPNSMSAPKNVTECYGLETGPAQWPMIDSVPQMDLTEMRAVTTRTFSAQRDLWLADHVPHKSFKHPLVSAIMALETFLESARVLVPYRTVTGFAEARFRDMITCPEGTERETRTSVRLIRRAGLPAVKATLEARAISPRGRQLDEWNEAFSAVVLFGERTAIADTPDLSLGCADFAPSKGPLRDCSEMYDLHTAYADRYRVIVEEHVVGKGFLAAKIRIPQLPDFAEAASAPLEYPAYVLEALMQAPIFHHVDHEGSLQRDPLPVHLGEVRFHRACQPGELLTVHVRIRREDENGQTWDGQAMDADGAIVMTAQSMTLAWTKRK